MKRIQSFSVDHDTLLPGLYISRQDGDISTLDLRFIKPNSPPFLDTAAMHTIEHLFATYARNSFMSENIVYFGPMGCRTGFYLLLKNVGASEAVDFVRETVRVCANHSGEIPGAKKIECGNYLEHNLPAAISALKNYYSVIENWTSDKLSY